MECEIDDGFRRPSEAGVAHGGIGYGHPFAGEPSDDGGGVSNVASDGVVVVIYARLLAVPQSVLAVEISGCIFVWKWVELGEGIWDVG